jgi:hypothetical protein
MWLLVIAGVVAAALCVCLVGLLTNALRLSVAGLPVGHGLFVISVWRSVLRGLIAAAMGLLVLLGSCAAAYTSRRGDGTSTVRTGRTSSSIGAASGRPGNV